MTRTNLLTEVMHLPVADRLALVREILESVDRETLADDLTPEQRAELRRRLQAYRADPSRGVPWEQVFADLTSGR